VINELLDRIEAAEKDIALKERIIDSIGSTLNAVAKERDALRVEVERLTECLHRANAQAEHFEREWYLRGDEVDALRAKIAEMEKQKPVAWLHETRRDSDVVTDAVKHVWGKAVVGAMAAYSIPLYLAPGAKGE